MKSETGTDKVYWYFSWIAIARVFPDYPIFSVVALGKGWKGGSQQDFDVSFALGDRTKKNRVHTILVCCLYVALGVIDKDGEMRSSRFTNCF